MAEAASKATTQCPSKADANVLVPNCNYPVLTLSAQDALIDALYHVRMVAAVLDWSCASAQPVGTTLSKVICEKLDTTSTIIQTILAQSVTQSQHHKPDANTTKSNKASDSTLHSTETCSCQGLKAEIPRENAQCRTTG